MAAHPVATPHPASPLQVRLNGEAVCLPQGATLALLLAQRGLDPATHATAVNGGFVARSQRASLLLHSGDEVTCFQAIVGG